jgi:hypothetical protein
MDHGHDELSRPLKILKKKERKESVLLAQFSKPREEERDVLIPRTKIQSHIQSHKQRKQHKHRAAALPALALAAFINTFNLSLLRRVVFFAFFSQSKEISHMHFQPSIFSSF